MRKEDQILPVDQFRDAKASYRNDISAARTSRFKRTRQGVPVSGAGADYHYRSDRDYLHLVEYAWDMYLNDGAIKPLIDAAIRNLLHGGINPDPQTGDKETNDILKALWKDWSEDSDQCDAQGKLDFRSLSVQVLTGKLVAGDILALPLRSGAIRLMESQRLRTPSNANQKRFKIVHGVKMTAGRKPIEYFFTKDEIDPHKTIRLVSDMIKIRARDRDGNKQVFHVYDPARTSQSRGLSALTPCFDLAGMFEDINFAKLVQQQAVSCITYIFNKVMTGNPLDTPPATGSATLETQDDGSSRYVENQGPGMKLFPPPGVEVTGFSPNIPNAEFFEQVKLILRLIGINLGVPLIAYMLDASETNFSGWRGAMDQAKMGFQDGQKNLVRDFHSPVYRWKVRQWMAGSPALAAAARQNGVNIFGARWDYPNWPYIQPLQDAQADSLLITSGLSSQRRVMAKNGQQIDEVRTETIGDNKTAIKEAMEAARELNKDLKDGEKPVLWQDILSLPQHAEIKIDTGGGQDEPELPANSQRREQ